MYILGFDCYGHDSAAALLRDGEILAMAEEERFSREKHTMAFPTAAIRYCLSEAGITIHDVDHIAYYWDSSLHVADQIWHIIRYFPRSLALVRSRLKQNFLPMMRLEQTLRRELGLNAQSTAQRIHQVEHHHARQERCGNPIDMQNQMHADRQQMNVSKQCLICPTVYHKEGYFCGLKNNPPFKDR